MQFRIADTFTASLGRLTNDQQKAAKTTAFDLQVNPAQPGHSLHRIASARDANFWSARVNQDIRIVVHRTDDGVTLHETMAIYFEELQRLKDERN